MLVTENQQECENLSLAKMFSGSDVTSYAIRSHTVRYDTIRDAIVTIGVARIFDWGVL